MAVFEGGMGATYPLNFKNSSRVKKCHQNIDVLQDNLKQANCFLIMAPPKIKS